MAPLQVPLISCMQKIVIYETKARYYVVGSNNTETRFRVLKIDRTEPKDLQITDDKVEYTQKEIRDLLMMIDVGNRPKVIQKGSMGLSKTVSAFGIVGFVRFLEGYYMILITKRRKVALLGAHTIYKIEDTSLVYLPNDVVRYTHPDEQRYLKIFQNVDLSSNFYFSYSYDLTHSLQYNLAPCRDLNSTPEKVESFMSSLSSDDMFKDLSPEQAKDTCSVGSDTGSGVCGVRNRPSRQYAWNDFLLRVMGTQVHSDWMLHVIHGFIGQSSICVYGRPIYLTLIARRSNQFAGTRFLKRGANFEGNVANEVETEQIVHDASWLSLQSGRYTSFVQLRGSIPAHWSQDTRMMPKPPITLDQSDPHGYLAGQHFNQVLKRYGAPIILLNLVKKREKRRHESILTEELVNVVQYLNQFLPNEHAIRYIGFDMARISKSKTSNVLHRLAEIAEYCVKSTGFFQSGDKLQTQEADNSNDRGPCGLSSAWQPAGQRQCGVVRTNCVDCLDRTNTAQFAMGKCALAFQLHCLGVLNSPSLEFDTDCIRMLEELYEDHGDTLALQYGGSQLVHRIKGYRKLTPWTSSSRDIMQTLSRYYSNTFSDAEKQSALNLFLGIFEPEEGATNLWELATDFYLHNKMVFNRNKSYCQWWEVPVVRSLPFAWEEEKKSTDTSLLVVTAGHHDERVDAYWDHYRPYELTSLDEVYTYHVPNSIRDFMPKSSKQYSPFLVRVQPGRRQEQAGPGEALYSLTQLMVPRSVPTSSKTGAKKATSRSSEVNPNISGKDSTASVASAGSEGSSSSSDGSDIDGDFEFYDCDNMKRADSDFSMVSLKDLFPTMKQVYGVDIKPLSKHNTTIYKRYSQIGLNATTPVDRNEARCDVSRTRRGTDLIERSVFPLDSVFETEPPRVDNQAKEIYDTYIRCGKHGAEEPSRRSLQMYREYHAVRFQ